METVRRTRRRPDLLKPSLLDEASNVRVVRSSPPAVSPNGADPRSAQISWPLIFISSVAYYGARLSCGFAVGTSDTPGSFTRMRSEVRDLYRRRSQSTRSSDGCVDKLVRVAWAQRLRAGRVHLQRRPTRLRHRCRGRVRGFPCASRQCALRAVDTTRCSVGCNSCGRLTTSRQVSASRWIRSRFR
jgi:hypothetical protein